MEKYQLLFNAQSNVKENILSTKTIIRPVSSSTSLFSENDKFGDIVYHHNDKITFFCSD